MSIEHSPAREPYRKLRVRDAANFLGLSASTLNKLRVYGGGPAFAKLGRAIVNNENSGLLNFSFFLRVRTALFFSHGVFL